MRKTEAIKNNVIYKILQIIIITCIVFFCVTSLIVFTKKIFIYPLKYKDEVVNISKTYNLDPALVYSVIKTESRFNKNAVSKKGAKGLMQLTDSTANYVASIKNVDEYDIFDIETNIDFGCFYLKYLQNKFFDLYTTLCAYNAGEGNVIIWLNNPQYSSDGLTLACTPYKETNNYIKKIKKSFINYQKLYRNTLDI